MTMTNVLSDVLTPDKLRTLMQTPSKPFFTILDFMEDPEVLGVGAAAVAQFCSTTAQA